MTNNDNLSEYSDEASLEAQELIDILKDKKAEEEC
jgi:hypothetical protein